MPVITIIKDKAVDGFTWRQVQRCAAARTGGCWRARVAKVSGPKTAKLASNPHGIPLGLSGAAGNEPPPAASLFPINLIIRVMRIRGALRGGNAGAGHASHRPERARARTLARSPAFSDVSALDRRNK